MHQAADAPASCPPMTGLPPAAPPRPEPARQTFMLETHRMTRSVPVTFAAGHEVAAVLSWKPVGRGADEWDVTFLVQVTG